MPICATAGCQPAALCAACYGRALHASRPQAAVLGQCWAEEVARRPEHRGREAWPNDARTLQIARRRVAALAKDERLLDELARACVHGAAAWWARRPARYQA